MTITLDLEPEQIESLTQQSTPEPREVANAVYRLIAAVRPVKREPVALSAKQQAAVALLSSWNAEEATLEERAQNDAEFEEFAANINRWRVEEGRAPAFP